MNVTAFHPESGGGLPRTPPDIHQAIGVFNATCGPLSFAAVVGTFVIEIMRFFPEFPQRHYTTCGDMAYALRHCGAEFRAIGKALPDTGLALIQIEGPWTNHGAPIAAQLRYTHWVGLRGEYIFDSNLEDWIEREEWLSRGAIKWMSTINGFTGFRVRAAYAISPRPFEFWPYGRVPVRPKPHPAGV